MAEDGLLGFLFKCCCGSSSLEEELYKDWESHPACQQYTIVKHLGQGGFSEVHLAQDKLTGKTVALKVVFLNKGGLTKEQRKILAGEARLVRMVAHPNIVRCLQVLETRRQQVLVLEYLSGGEMLRQLQRLKRYSEANACQMFKQIVNAVAYLHSLGILHRDIKPENCLLAKPPAHAASKNKPIKVKLIDLGMAGLYRPDKPMKGCMGSPGFIAPEVILGEHHTPAMDMYSLGVLLFIMLVGRKPWDAQRSHTLAYAVQPTCEAPALGDPVYAGLSAPAKQLLLWMLDEDPSRRPSAQQVLGHTWVLQGGVCKGAGSSVEAGGAAGPSRVYQQVVQQRLQVLSRSRDIMGTAKGMMVLHGRGSRSQAVLFHRAVKAARLQLQQQAAALQASGQLGAAEGGQGGINGSPEQQQQQQQQQGGGAISAAAAPAGSGAGGSAQQVAGSTPAVAGSTAVGSSAAATAGSTGPAANSSSVSPETELARSSAPAASAVRPRTGSSTSRQGLVRPASAGALAAGAAAAAAGSSGSNDAAAGEPPESRRQKSVTVGQLAREDLLSRHSLLFGALQQQQQQGQGAGARVAGVPSGNPPVAGRHRHAASEGSARLGTGTTGQGAAAGMSAAASAAGAAAAGGYAQPISIDLRQLALVDAMERGMSAPNTDIPLFSPPAGGSRALQHPRRTERAVSMSPGALALLDAEDQMCLLQAAASEEDDGAALLAGGVLSWGRRGAADMMASFKEHYAVRPFARSIRRFGDSLSRSLGRSGRSPRAQAFSASPPAASYMQAAAAAAATDAHLQPQSRSSSDTVAPAAAAAAAPAAAPAAAAASLVAEAAGMPSFTQQGPATAGQYVPAATTDQDEISFRLAAASRGPTQDEQPMVSSSVTAGAAAAAVAAAAAAAAAQLPCSSTNSLINRTSPHVALMRLSEDSTSEQQQGSLETHGAFLGAQMSLDGSLGLSTLGTSLDARSPHSASKLQEPRSAGWMPLRAVTPADMARISVGGGSNSGSSAGPGVDGTNAGAVDAGVGNAGVLLGGVKVGSHRASAFASTASAVAAAVVLDSAAASSSAAGAQHGGRNSAVGAVAVVQSPGLRAAATAAAARAEEEGIGLPNGLWLQQSQSLKSSTIANILSLLSPAKLHSASAGQSGSLDLGGQGLGSAGGSVELAAAGCISSETSSGPLSPTAAAAAGGALTSPGQLEQQDGEWTEVAGAASAGADGREAAATSLAAAASSSEGHNTAQAGSSRSPSPVSHSRNISIMSWLPEANTSLQDVMSMPAPEAPNSAALDGAEPLTPTAATSNTSSSAAAAAAAAGTATASVDIAGGNSVLLHAPSGAGSSVDQEFYVGSFWSPSGLSGGGAHAACRQQQLGSVGGRARGYLAHSTSSLGRLDSLQDSLQGQDSLNAATPGLPLDLEDVSSALLLSPQAAAAAEVTSDGGDGGAEGGDGDGDYVSTGSQSRRSSISTGVAAGAGGHGGGRGSLDGGEGMLEGCLPGDGSGDTWGRAGRMPHRGAGASVLVHVHSGGMREGETQPGKAAATQGLRNGSSALQGAGAAASAGRTQAATAAEPGVAPQSPSKYGWIAKTVVSRAASPHKASAQQQPQFDAFDEPHGEWYYTGAT